MGTGGFWNVNTGEHLFAARGSKTEVFILEDFILSAVP